jgi:UDP-glucose 4-epimerase
MKILITGGAGFIGSHLVDKLSSLGYEVFVIDNLSTGCANNLNLQFKNLFKIDIQNKDYIAQVFDYIKPDVVYHLAAQINVRDSIINPIKDAEINTVGTLNILNECVKHKVKKIIFSSSGGAIYQDNEELIKTENSKIEPVSPYGISKWTGEQYINFYKKIYGLDSTILRFSNVYGPRQAGGECGVLGIFIKNALENKTSNIFGNGEQVRDYVYVEDVVNALILSLNISGTYNVSTGIGTTVNYLANKIKQNFNTQFEYAPKIEGELFRNCLSSQLLQFRSWNPKTNIDEGIKKTIKWFTDKRDS